MLFDMSRHRPGREKQESDPQRGEAGDDDSERFARSRDAADSGFRVFSLRASAPPNGQNCVDPVDPKSRARAYCGA